MSDFMIRAEGLSKQYRIGAKQEHYRTLRDTLMEAIISPFQRMGKLVRGQATSAGQLNETIWALKGVSCEIKRGEVVGVIGRNGAGKSTLLKILSRVAEPTGGFAEVYGRLGSLLEVGTGFHPELTGRENIYLNGAILGMRKAEIQRKFDEIVAFAEVEKFLDTPVKHYSSGMYLRLAFAVAAHLEPEVLLVDEVLAVGDVEFQRKCLGKMGDVVKEGRTVLFVSHNMAAVLALCPRSILLNGGCITADGPTQEVVDQYIQTISRVADIPLAERLDEIGDQTLKFVAFELRDYDGRSIPCAYSGQDVVIALKYTSQRGRSLKDVYIYLLINSSRFGEPLFQLSTRITGSNFKELPSNGTILCKIPRLPLRPGKYYFSLFAKVGSQDTNWIPNAGTLEVEAGDFFGSGKLPLSDKGPFLVPHSWGITST